MAKKRNLYVWIMRTDEGEKREVQAELTGKKWTLMSRLVRSRHEQEEEWVVHAKPSLEDLEDLETMLFNKYQRKHGSWEQVLSVRELIAQRGQS